MWYAHQLVGLPEQGSSEHQWWRDQSQGGIVLFSFFTFSWFLIQSVDENVGWSARKVIMWFVHIDVVCLKNPWASLGTYSKVWSCGTPKMMVFVFTFLMIWKLACLVNGLWRPEQTKRIKANPDEQMKLQCLYAYKILKILGASNLTQCSNFQFSSHQLSDSGDPKHQTASSFWKV